VLARLGRLADAVASYDRAIALDPNNSQAHNNRGVVLIWLGQLTDAVASHERAIVLDLMKGDRHQSRGIALALLGELGDALAEFELAEHFSPEDTGKAGVWAAAILWYCGDPAAARDRFANIGKRFTGCSPFHTIVLETIALCGVGQVDTQRLQDALDLRVVSDRAESRGLFGLLSNPPLAGIEDIRRIVESD
jgi:tetratricopeptide (TPR) repeat protein